MKNQFTNFMQALMEFEACTVESDFMEMFGKINGKHLWEDFKRKCSNNTTIFYRMLEPNQRKKFEDYLYTNYRNILIT